MTKNGITADNYQYDGRGLRTVKTVNEEDTLFVYCKSGKLIAEADSDGNVLKEYIYLEGDIFAHFQYDVPAGAPLEATPFAESSQAAVPEPVADQQETVPPAVAETSTPSDTAFLPAIYLLLLMKDKSADGAYYYINDHLGAPQVITDDAGSVVWKAEYLPFGNVNILTAEIENNLRFPGQYFDTETGLHYNWNRYYDPETGRYISADPIGLDGGMNLYAYVGGDPVNGVDFEGLVPQGERGASGGASGQNSNKPNKHCREYNPPDPRFVKCRHHQTGQWVRKPRPADMPYPGQSSRELCGETCKKVVTGVTLTGILIIKYICTGGPLNPATN